MSSVPARRPYRRKWFQFVFSQLNEFTRGAGEHGKKGCYDVTPVACKMAAFPAGGSDNALLLTDSYKVRVVPFPSALDSSLFWDTKK
ncbi:hypothetical protein BaRGS_00025105 [Batillaria attramentaria]|uniref:Uncharacterized protein n=1 Tax=Batillaria attramentaria TaxID=370345 RepID=A0ABD0K999_9CAEN